MKRQPLLLTLIAALFINAVAAPYLSFRFIQITRELNRLKWEYNAINSKTQLLQQLLSEALEYGRKDPTIDPLLEKIGVKPKPTPPVTTAKPAAR